LPNGVPIQVPGCLCFGFTLYTVTVLFRQFAQNAQNLSG